MKKMFEIMGVCSVIIAVCGSCQVEEPAITTGEEIELTDATIGSDGGIIVVDKDGDPLDGLTITVPEGAYPETTRFDMSYRPVTEHAPCPMENSLAEVRAQHKKHPRPYTGFAFLCSRVVGEYEPRFIVPKYSLHNCRCWICRVSSSSIAAGLSRRSCVGIG